MTLETFLIAAKKALLPIFRSGYDYAKAGILLSRFTNEDHQTIFFI